MMKEESETYFGSISTMWLQCRRTSRLDCSSAGLIAGSGGEVDRLAVLVESPQYSKDILICCLPAHRWSCLELDSRTTIAAIKTVYDFGR